MAKPVYKAPYPLLPKDTPLMFTDGSQVYKDLAKKYTTHKVGYFIMTPSGAGKTYFVQRQAEPHWIDGDDLWQLTFAQPDGEWWLESREFTDEVDARSDVITVEAKKLGFWIVGSCNNWLRPDAIVIPDWETQKKWITNRETGEYDGGATSDRLDQVQSHRQWIQQWAAKGVPEFKTVQEATDFLAAKPL